MGMMSSALEEHAVRGYSHRGKLAREPLDTSESELSRTAFLHAVRLEPQSITMRGDEEEGEGGPDRRRGDRDIRQRRARLGCDGIHSRDIERR